MKNADAHKMVIVKKRLQQPANAITVLTVVRKFFPTCRKKFLASTVSDKSKKVIAQDDSKEAQEKLWERCLSSHVLHLAAMSQIHGCLHGKKKNALLM